jgi:aspartate aminotransferase
MARLAHAAESIPRSGIRHIMDAAWSIGEPVIGLHVGEPSFTPPAHVIEVAQEAYAAGDTHYVPNAGIGSLREALAEKITSRNGFTVSEGQVVVSAGGVQALDVAMSLAVSAGDEVLIPDPGWPNFAMAIGLHQGVPVHYSLRAENGFLPDLDELESLVTDRTRMILVNTPSNPLGTVLGAELVEALVRFADRHDIWLLSDECYDALTFGAEHVSPGRFDEQGRVLSAFSFSKTYAMTGLRVGYLACPGTVAEVAAKLQEASISCVNAPAQAAALAALRGPQTQVDSMRHAYLERRDAAMGALDDLAIPYLRPQGAFYLWANVAGRTTAPVAQWALDLLRTQHVAVAPGTAFGPVGEGWVRLSLATATEELLEGIRRIGAMGDRTS